MLGDGGLSMLNHCLQGSLDDVQAEGPLSALLLFVASARICYFGVLLRSRQASSEDHWSTVVQGSDVQLAVGLVQGHESFVVAPKAAQWGGRRFEVRLVVQSHKEPELCHLHGFVHRGVLEATLNLLLPGVLPVGKRAHPEVGRLWEPTQPCMGLDAGEQLHQLLAPPLDHEPCRRLLLAGEKLSEATILLFGGRLEDPVVHLVSRHRVNRHFQASQRVSPPVAVVPGPVHESLELGEGDGAVLGAVDVALEAEGLVHLLQVPFVIAAIER
mmetsp:Transcript_46145/g.98824  ORF Transcript_46145/g.98824 Transcript_46145/m.98824 type:complete len:271 (-) Transcript_46145:444-1256(-)